MRQPTTIGLVFDYSLSYARGVLRGVKAFAQTRPHWILVPLGSDGLNQRALRAMRPAGLVALVVNERLAGVLRNVRRPLVNVASVLPGLSFPQVRVDHREIGRLAARHLRDRAFRNFGFVGHPHHFYSTEREAGFRQALTRERRFVAYYHEHPARSYRQRARLMVLSPELQNWLRALPKPAGVFAC